MKLHILSDLHLEFLAYAPPALDADAVVLAGDIGLGTRGIRWARQAWPETEIVYVPGNHEYYRSEMEVENELLRAAAHELGVHLLNRDEAIIGGVRFLGATLWTDFRLFGEGERFHALQAALHGLSDFRVIDCGPQAFTPEDSAELHRLDAEWLEGRLLREPFEGKTVVVTHHLPSMRSVAQRFRHELLSACFASNVDYLLGQSALWVHGHTHDSFDYDADGTRVVCNPRGYCRAGQPPENRQFNPALVVEV